jgi:hypothetical protein
VEEEEWMHIIGKEEKETLRVLATKEEEFSAPKQYTYFLQSKFAGSYLISTFTLLYTFLLKFLELF